MKLTEYAVIELIPFVTGDNGISIRRSGPQLVSLFNKYGYRDIYDSQNGGLPKLTEKQTLNTSRKDYTKSRLSLLNGKNELRSLLESIINESVNREQCADEINQIISPENFQAKLDKNIYIIIGGKIVHKQTVKNNVKFSQIENDILGELDKAKVSIILAMAWFTNNVLLDKLKEKRESGIRVEIVIYDDGVNSKHGVNLTGFDYIKIKAQRGGIMHNKFCVIDNQVVIHGSYNWSNNAEYRNDETVTIIEDPHLATEFSVKFRELKSRNTKEC